MYWYLFIWLISSITVIILYTKHYFTISPVIVDSIPLLLIDGCLSSRNNLYAQSRSKSFLFSFYLIRLKISSKALVFSHKSLFNGLELRSTTRWSSMTDSSMNGFIYTSMNSGKYSLDSLLQPYSSYIHVIDIRRITSNSSLRWRAPVKSFPSSLDVALVKHSSSLVLTNFSFTGFIPSLLELIMSKW